MKTPYIPTLKGKEAKRFIEKADENYKKAMFRTSSKAICKIMKKENLKKADKYLESINICSIQEEILCFDTNITNGDLAKILQDYAEIYHNDQMKIIQSDINNKLSPVVNLLQLINTYVSDDGSMLNELVDKEVKQVEKSVEYLKNLPH